MTFPSQTVSMKVTLTTFAPLIVVTSLVACGGGDETSDADRTTSGTSNGGVDGAAATAVQSNGDRPSGAGEDFPVAIPDGWVIDIHGRAGLEIQNQIQVLYPLDQFESVVAFYDQWTTEQPADYNRSDTDETVLFRLASPLHQIAISNNYEEQGQRYVVLQITVAGN